MATPENIVGFETYANGGGRTMESIALRREWNRCVRRAPRHLAGGTGGETKNDTADADTVVRDNLDGLFGDATEFNAILRTDPWAGTSKVGGEVRMILSDGKEATRSYSRKIEEFEVFRGDAYLVIPNAKSANALKKRFKSITINNRMDAELEFLQTDCERTSNRTRGDLVTAYTIVQAIPGDKLELRNDQAIKVPMAAFSIAANRNIYTTFKELVAIPRIKTYLESDAALRVGVYAHIAYMLANATWAMASVADYGDKVYAALKPAWGDKKSVVAFKAAHDDLINAWEALYTGTRDPDLKDNMKMDLDRQRVWGTMLTPRTYGNQPCAIL